jgi:hypothetical protein
LLHPIQPWEVRIASKSRAFLTEGGSTKLPRGNGSLMKTVYDGSELDMVISFEMVSFAEDVSLSELRR